MSRKSIESSAIWSRSRRSGFRPESSSSGAMVRMMSLTASTISSRVMGSPGVGGLLPGASQDDRRVDSEHAEGKVEDVLDPPELLRLVGDEVAHLAGRVEVVEVDRRVHPAVLEGGQVARELERAGRAHGVADEALGVVDVRARAVAEDGAQRLALLLVALRRGRRVAGDDVDLARRDPRALER